jgi:hypothetical protein
MEGWLLRLQRVEGENGSLCVFEESELSFAPFTLCLE